MRAKSAELEDEMDRATHDAEHAESGAAMARMMGDSKTAAQLNLKASALRQRAADIATVELGRAMAEERKATK